MEKRTFPLGDKELKIGMIGFTEGNAHPFSWSAIYNGCNMEEMRRYTLKDYPSIPDYLSKQPPETFGIPGAHVTHIACKGWAGREMAEAVAKASFVPNVLDNPEDMIGQVDAVVCATDIGSEHVERCRPFIEAGLPVFIDKPLTDNEEDLRTIVKWYDEGAHILSSSGLRYSKNMEPYYKNHYEFGNFRYIISPMGKYWETYGMHAIDNIFPLLGCGFEWVENVGTKEKPMVHMYHKNNCHVTIPMGIPTMGTTICGEYMARTVTTTDTYYGFKKQMVTFIDYIRSGVAPYPFEETIEAAKLIIAGIRSREEGGRRVYLSEIHER